MMRQENYTLSRHALLENTSSRKDDGLIEELFGEFPIMSGRPTADVALTEKRREEHPRIGYNLFVTCQFDWNMNIQAMTYSSKPALFAPACEHLGGSAAISSQGS
jgi:hypothetical protein